MSARRLRASSNGATFEIDVDAERVRLRAESGAANDAAAAAATAATTSFQVTPIDPNDGDIVRIAPDDADAAPLRAHVVANGDTTWVFIDGETFTIDVEPVDQSQSASQARPRRRSTGNEGLSAPMPATVIKVLAEPGAQVQRGDMLLLLEAMKMELPIRAPRDGRVKVLHCRPGELVQPGTVLVDLE
jgi:biotin carboxyl carrier protein